MGQALASSAVCPPAIIENAVDRPNSVVLLAHPEIVVQTWRATRKIDRKDHRSEVREAIERLNPVWDELFPAEQARIVQLLVDGSMLVPPDWTFICERKGSRPWSTSCAPRLTIAGGQQHDGAAEQRRRPPDGSRPDGISQAWRPKAYVGSKRTEISPLTGKAVSIAL